MSTKVNQERLASVVGRALLDKGFAAALSKDPQGAAQGIGVHLSTTEVAAVKSIDMTQLTSAASAIRDKIGVAAIFDTQQQQARMD
jgi:hypothetical protein